MAEAHPVGFRWVMKAKERGATIIHVDPRFSRTSALADIWVPIRAGGDIAFLGGIVRHVIENDLFFRDYVVHFTNASCVLREDFRDTEEGAAGFFSGWNEEERAYNKESWSYEGHPDLSFPERDPTLQHPRCVFQTLRRHFARYTPEMVEKICGIPPSLFHKVADALVRSSGPDKTAAICYALGWTQHSKGVQIIRTASILQLLLGNIGRPGGGILALRGHASIQGSTDIPTLYDILPGYLSMPKGDGTEETLRDYLAHQTKPTGLWNNYPSYFISLMKAYYGKNATTENDFGYNWVPKLTGNHSFFEYLYDMADGKMEGMFMMGQNPAVAGANSRFQRTSLSKLKWLVVRDMVEIEGATFWCDSPEIERGELKTEDIDTEVFFFPAAGHAEKEGAFTQTQRMLQWREKAVNPPGDARSEGWFMHQLALRLIAKAKQSSDPLDEPLRALDWWYRKMSTVSRTWNLCSRKSMVGSPAHSQGPMELSSVASIGKANRITVRRSKVLRNSKPMARPQAGAGSIPAFLVRTKSTKRTRGTQKIISATAGGSSGRPIAALYIIERAPNRRANRGASARNWSGGTRRNANGTASTFLILSRTSRLIIARPEMKADWLEFPGMRPSSCMRTVSAGCMSRKAYRMDRCRRTTNRSSRR